MYNNQSENENTPSRLLKIIEDKGKLIMFLVGVLLLFFSNMCIWNTNQDTMNKWKPLLDVLGQIGGIFVSSVAVAYFYEKYRDRNRTVQLEEYFKKYKENNKNYIRVSSKGMQEKIYVECIDREFIDIIPRKELDRNDNYRFEVMAQRMAEQSDEKKRDHPVLIYGSTLGLFNWIGNKDVNEPNKTSLIQAVKKGVHFKLALNTPDAINSNNADKDKEKKETITNVVDGLKGIIAEELSNACGSIDLRFLPIVEKNSFSSFISDGRKVNVLDFNFESDCKMSQIFDEKESTQNKNENLADLLMNSYESAHKKGIPCISFNTHEMLIYVIGIKNKQVLMYKEDSGYIFPHITVTEKGKVEEIGREDDNQIPDNIYESIKSIYMKKTNCDIQLSEFISPDKSEGNRYFVIGLINSEVDGTNDIQWKNVCGKNVEFELSSSLEITHTYFCRLKNLLRGYGVE